MSDSPRAQTLILFALWLMVFASSSQIMIISPILPDIGKALSINKTLQGWLFMAYTLPMAVFALFVGPISDRVGRRKMLLLGNGTMAIFLFMHIIAYSFPTFLILRGLTGISAGFLSGAAVSYVGDYFPYEKRGWANGWVMSGVAFGQVLGIPMGVSLAGALGYKAPFLLFSIPMLLALVLTYLYVPQPNVKRSEERITGAHLFRSYQAVLTKPAVPYAALSYFLMFFSLIIFVTFLPTWLEQTLHTTKYHIASMYLVGGIANVLIGPQMGKLSDQIGRKPLILTSTFGMAVLMISTTLVIQNLWVAYATYFVAMVLVAMRLSPMQALLSALVPAEQRGTLMSLIVGVGHLGSTLGGGLAGLLYEVGGYQSNTYAGAMALLFMGLMVWQKLPEPKMQAQTS